jgi:hypothetical protein
MKEQLTQWILASGGWLVAIFTLTLGYRERKQAREEERLARTLDYFDSSSQRRSIGIALIEGLWANKPDSHDVIVPLIANQIVYLLLSTTSVDPHNERNLVRLFMIFKAIPNLNRKYWDRRCDVADAISRKLEGEDKGIPVTPATLKIWMQALGEKVDA